MNFVIWGEDKSTKNTLAFTAPKPMVDMELDIGGFHRACRNLSIPENKETGYAGLNLPIKDWYSQGLIRLEQFPMPFQIGKVDLITSTITPTKLVVGMKELFYKFAGRFIALLEDEEVQTIMIDTGSLMYDMVCQAYLQELQEKQLPIAANGKGSDGKPLRTQLQQIEYREPYIRMRGFAYQAKAHNKHLVVTHHATDEYGFTKMADGTIGKGVTGKRTLHGWGQWGDSADVVGQVYWDSKLKKPFFKVELAEVKEMEGWVCEEPTFDKIQGFIKMVRGD